MRSAERTFPGQRRLEAEKAAERQRTETELAERLERLASLTHYEVLQVAPTADDAEIQAARAQLESQFHPDRWTPDRLTAKARRLTEQATLLVRRAADQLLSRDERTRYDRALGLAERPAQADPVEAEIAYQLGLAAMENEDPAEAEAQFRRALDRAPNEADYIASLAEALLSQDSWDEASTLLQRAVELTPTSRSVSLAHARLHRRKSEKEEALDWYGRVLKVDPDCREAREFLAAQDKLFVRRQGLLSRLTKGVRRAGKRNVRRVGSSEGLRGCVPSPLEKPLANAAFVAGCELFERGANAPFFRSPEPPAIPSER